MRLVRSLRSSGPIAGWTAVAAMLLLASPGVQVVRAETPGAEPAEGLVCKAPADVAADRRAEMARFLAQLEAELAPAGDGEVRRLNGRGYGYHAAPDMARELQRIELEAGLAREARQKAR
ncbi:MAG: hypothetical protein R3263_01270 [Myxococcota bacterium]|nr:hypothetical protein [Myxococcota bacterium]